jgi:hypothetical protein
MNKPNETKGANMEMTWTREQVIKVLRAHGLETSSLTATKDGKWLAFSSFDAEMRIRPKYKVLDVRKWLGY